jgi:CPA2 family monovalent cation:H+ antiporter-2
MLNSVLIVGIAIGMHFAAFNIPGMIDSLLLQLEACAATILLASPFLWAVLRSRPLYAGAYNAETLERLQRLQFGVAIVRFLFGCILVFFLVGNFLEITSPAGWITVVATVSLLFAFGRVFEWMYQHIEAQFVSQLSEKERAVVEERSTLAHLAPWESTLTEFTLSEYSPLVLKTLSSSNLKRDYGVTIAIIGRGEKNIVAPKSDEVLLPRDRLFLIGTYEQLATVREKIETQPDSETGFDDDTFGMIPLRLNDDHTFVGKTIKDCGLRETINGLIVGIERDDQRFLNPDPMVPLQSGDLVWLVGEKELLRKL